MTPLVAALSVACLLVWTWNATRWATLPALVLWIVGAWVIGNAVFLVAVGWGRRDRRRRA